MRLAPSILRPGPLRRPRRRGHRRGHRHRPTGGAGPGPLRRRCGGGGSHPRDAGGHRGQVAELGRQCQVVPTNIRDLDQVEALHEQVFERWGRVDFLINNAGGQFPSLPSQISDNGWRAVVDLNLNGTWNMVSRFMGPDDRGGLRRDRQRGPHLLVRPRRAVVRPLGGGPGRRGEHDPIHGALSRLPRRDHQRPGPGHGGHLGHARERGRPARLQRGAVGRRGRGHRAHAPHGHGRGDRRHHLVPLLTRGPLHQRSRHRGRRQRVAVQLAQLLRRAASSESTALPCPAGRSA